MSQRWIEVTRDEVHLLDGQAHCPSAGFELGDRVVATHDLGGFWRPRVRRGSLGIVIGYRIGGTLLVHFTLADLVVEDNEVVGPGPGTV